VLKMECSEVKAVLKCDSDVEITENKGLVSHVRSCRECSEKYGFILKLSLATAAKDEMRLPADFEDRVWKKIGEPNPSFSFLRNILQPKWAFAAAAALVLFLVAVPLMNKGPEKNSPKEIAVKPADNKVVEIKQGIKAASGDNLKKSAQTGSVVAESAVEKQAHQKQEPAAAPKQVQPGAAGITAKYSAPAPSNKTAGNTAAGGKKISSAGINQVQKELTASYNKVEDDLKGDVAVSGNVFHPLQGETVTIKYRIKNAARVIMAVYDRRGKAVKMIYNGEQAPGIYSETWNGAGDNGIISAGGIYIIYLKTDSAENRIKVGVIK
jgi:hypothetical protein